MQIGFYFDQSRCTGCCTCAVACKDWHDVPAGPARLARILENESGRYPNPSLSYLFSACWHCAKPACIEACPAGAIAKREEDGIVVVDRDACLGKECGACLGACPYGAPQFGAEDDAKMQKCDFCLERWADKKKPVCVEACPMRALDASLLGELAGRYGNAREAEGFICSEQVSPSVVFRIKAHSMRNEEVDDGRSG